jgi:hypothetical protein
MYILRFYVLQEANADAAGFLADPAVSEHWRGLVGLETLHSYGAPVI